MSTPRLSVIIPTYNRKEILLKALQSYQQQTGADDILEILVVDDGSTDGTALAVAQSAEGSPFPIRYLHQENRGLSSARNHGIREARGEMVLFVDDDIVASRNFVSEHMAWHRRYPEASVGVLGHVAWSPEVHPTPFMKWLGSAGPLLDYTGLSRGTPVDAGRCQFGITSLKTNFLRENGMFDEDFRTYGYEDVELGYRLIQKGWRLLYNPDAVGYHYKFMTFADVCRRQEIVDLAYELLVAKVPAMARVEPAPSPKAPAWRRVRRSLFCLLAPAFAFVLDTRIPLPWSVYNAFYSYAMPRAKAKQRTIAKQ